MDFTIKTYNQLLSALIAQGYTFQPYVEFLENPQPHVIILRHDVDLRPQYSLRFARLQHKAGVKGSYYFRMVPQSYDEAIIKEIAALGHEIGYHYENMDTCKGDTEKALENFTRNLTILRKLAPIRTICMHGSPLSKWDNRELWSKPHATSHKPQALSSSPYALSSSPYALRPSPYAHYRDYGIIGEPYFDTDFSRVFYLTDTGRRWDGEKVSVRDKVDSQRSAVGGRQSAVSSQEQRSSGTQELRNLEPGTRNLKLHITADIIAAASAGLLPDQIMFTFHPQRWTDKPLPWVKELVMQRVKNAGKRLLLMARGVGRRA